MLGGNLTPKEDSILNIDNNSDAGGVGEDEFTDPDEALTRPLYKPERPQKRMPHPKHKSS